MGRYIFDQYTLLHISVGVVAFFWHIPFWLGLAIHALFEFVENTVWGVSAINRYIIDPGYIIWPGGKYAPDTLMNQSGDNLGFAGGWLFAWWINSLGQKYGWYQTTPHA
jgi:hypothetical protein